MTEIPSSLRLLFETELERDGDRYVLPIPSELIDGGSISTDETYRIALLAAQEAGSDETASTPRQTIEKEETSSPSPSPSPTSEVQTPPVTEGETRSVTIDTLGDQGDGIAKVERGFIVIVPGTQPGDQAKVEITDVRDTVAFAEPIEDPTVR
ncbi:TRAM domain-containing protein [Haloarcula marina]|uniref:TRAM domain-containing protein n=1 Tax=Haloarcula marina TaxID=2961574 RepID=UPI0020B80A0F|nr:TRAM domain-containing protein [Halomicroarcula marina]